MINGEKRKWSMSVNVNNYWDQKQLWVVFKKKVKLQVYRPYSLQLNKKSTVKRQLKKIYACKLKNALLKKRNLQWGEGVERFILESTKYLKFNESIIYHHLQDICKAVFREKFIFLYVLIIIMKDGK